MDLRTSASVSRIAAAPATTPNGSGQRRRRRLWRSRSAPSSTAPSTGVPASATNTPSAAAVKAPARLSRQATPRASISSRSVISASSAAAATLLTPQPRIRVPSRLNSRRSYQTRLSARPQGGPHDAEGGHQQQRGGEDPADSHEPGERAEAGIARRHLLQAQRQLGGAIETGLRHFVAGVVAKPAAIASRGQVKRPQRRRLLQEAGVRRFVLPGGFDPCPQRLQRRMDRAGGRHEGRPARGEKAAAGTGICALGTLMAAFWASHDPAIGKGRRTLSRFNKSDMCAAFCRMVGHTDVGYSGREVLALFCRTGSCLAAFPVESVAETMRPVRAEPLAGQPSFVLGIALIRGQPTPVIDAGELVSGVRQSHPTRYVTLKLGQRRVAVAVDAVIGARRLSGLTDLPPLLQRPSFTSLGKTDDDLLVVLSAARMVPDAVWDAIAGQVD